MHPEIPRPRCLAFYLPQYHPIPENDLWWGAGFTEWTNVTRARPRFRGHYQPHVPADLGYYDLRVAESRAAQADLARSSGVDGFVYYHYWFNGRRVLERPFDEVLASGEPDLPFCLAWANENWTRVWDGHSGSPLLTQDYSTEDDLDHARALLPAFADPRYITHDGRPVFLVYRAGLLPDARRTTDTWRQEVVRAGLPEPYLLRVESFPGESGEPRALGFDAAVEFAPRWWALPPAEGVQRLREKAAALRGRPGDRVRQYDEVAALAMKRPEEDYTLWPGLTPMWDNAARRERGALILRDSSPERYEQWLNWALRRSRGVASREGSGSSGFVFVNAWNEWAEGNHLEPDQKYGRAYLEAHARAVRSVAGS